MTFFAVSVIIIVNTPHFNRKIVIKVVVFMKILHLYNQNSDRKNLLLGQSYTVGLKPRLLYFSAATENNERLGKIHMHEFTEIAFVVNGRGITTVNGTTYELYTGDLVIYNAGVPHSVSSQAKEDLEVHLIAFDQFEVSGLPPNCLLPPDYDFLYHTGSMYNTFRVLLRQILVETDNKEIYYNEIAQSTSQVLLLYLLRMVRENRTAIRKTEKSDVLYRALQYIDQHYLDPLTLDQIAEHCFVSKFYLSHLFAKYKDCTVGQYILDKRLTEAKRLLNFTPLSILEIAQQCGFGDQSYFCRTFKREIGVTPRAYRQNTRPF